MFRSLLRPSAAVFRTIPASHSVILRHATTTATPTIKPNIKLIAEIRKTIEGVSMMKAKEALIQSDNNLEKALEWVREDEAKSGIKKAEKLKDRQALEGLIGVVVGEVGEHGNRGAIVEVNCETDFVSRNDLFKGLVSQIASTALFVVDGSPAIGSGTGDQKGLMQEVPVSDLLQAPILPDPAAATTNAQAQQQELITVQESITKMIAKLSENISLRRCAVVNIPENQRGLVLTGGATHGGENHPITGKLGAISVLTLVSKQGASKKVVPSIAVTTLSRQLTRHLIASPSLTIYQEDCKIPLEISNGGHAPPEEVDAWLDERVLMRQPFVFGGGKVEQVISKIAKEEGLRIKVVDAVRWERGEGMVKAEAADFAEEVRHQLEKK
ncbi:elongation factor TS-domain-containing protein [Lobosporangium transversale]|uniref:Elongation factor Ts, mitochondrial n=1 Tax=Lobosporangium transversale TaxID=64571 RepID=A0A1Y2GSM1_9FUNG|nr:elongation factor TS-domain-containing protein [Lobosporangium transversale]ORZ21784.1 elongation factor TS-domain-containing protein [Lobosporangium transversale]|eukprot:XP_021883035.1 elongation factor TS-domain-containing protein [Lobosporangium transversale]